MKNFVLSLVLILLVDLSTQQTYNFTTAFEMLRASSAAYCSGSQLQNMNCGAVCDDLKGYTFLLQYVYTISSLESISYSMFVNPSTKRFVSSFRGSAGIQQLIDEVEKGGAIPFDLYDIADAEATAYFYSYYKDNIRSNFWANFNQALQDYPEYELYFVGHSLGGAFATIALLDVGMSGFVSKNRIHMYNYGSPRVGNIELANAVQANAGELFRVVHYKDLVPHVPPCDVDNQGICQQTGEIKITGDGSIIWPAWHVSPQVFYEDEASTTYKICTQGEDPTCADQYPLVQGSISDHLTYLGVRTECGGNSAFNLEYEKQFLGNEILRSAFVRANPWIFSSSSNI